MALPIEDFINKPFFAYVSDLASELGVSAYVFGGAVRDCYLCRAYSNIDIVLSGDPIEFSGRIARKLGVKASYFKNSRIAKLHFKGDAPAQDHLLQKHTDGVGHGNPQLVQNGFCLFFGFRVYPCKNIGGSCG